MSVKKIYLLFLIVCTFALNNACASNPFKPETKCTLNLSQAPELRGIRLGMTSEELKKRFPSIIIPKNDENGITNIEISSYQFSNEIKTEFKGINEINLKLLDNHVTSFKITYEPSSDPEFVQTVVNKLQENLRLGAEFKGTQSGTNFNLKVPCEGFDVKVQILDKGGVYGGNYTPFFYITVEFLNLQEADIPKTRLEDRKKQFEAEQKAREAEKRDTFEP